MLNFLILIRYVTTEASNKTSINVMNIIGILSQNNKTGLTLIDF